MSPNKSKGVSEEDAAHRVHAKVHPLPQGQTQGHLGAGGQGDGSSLRSKPPTKIVQGPDTMDPQPPGPCLSVQGLVSKCA